MGKEILNMASKQGYSPRGNTTSVPKGVFNYYQAKENARTFNKLKKKKTHVNPSAIKKGAGSLGRFIRTLGQNNEKG